MYQQYIIDFVLYTKGSSILYSTLMGYLLWINPFALHSYGGNKSKSMLYSDTFSFRRFVENAMAQKLPVSHQTSAVHKFCRGYFGTLHHWCISFVLTPTSQNFISKDTTFARANNPLIITGKNVKLCGSTQVWPI